MSRQEWDSFKQHFREWMDSHSGEYDAFEAGMNRRDDAGYQMVLAVAMGLAPEYEKIVSKRSAKNLIDGEGFAELQDVIKDYVDILKENHIRISMTENGDLYKNAIDERMNGILKTEWLNLEKFDTFELAKARIAEVIEIYNNVRPHLSCGMATPVEAHVLSATLVMLWKKRNYAPRVRKETQTNCKQIPVLKTNQISYQTDCQIL